MKKPLHQKPEQSKDDFIQQLMFWWYSVSPPERLIDLLANAYDEGYKRGQADRKI